MNYLKYSRMSKLEALFRYYGVNYLVYDGNLL